MRQWPLLPGLQREGGKGHRSGCTSTMIMKPSTTDWCKNYFNNPCGYPPLYFYWRYLIWRSLFLQIFDMLNEHCHISLLELMHSTAVVFPCTKNALLSFACSPTIALLTPRWLYKNGVTPSNLAYIEHFYKDSISSFGEEYSCRPIVDDFNHLLAKGEEKGFLGTLGSVDYLHWKWRSCFVGRKWQFTRGDIGPRPSCSKWLPHMTYKFGMLFWVAGSNNEINMLK